MAEVTDINGFKEKLSTMLANLPAEVGRINEGLAHSIIPFITTRLIDTGIDGNGKKLGTYSTKPLPTFFFTHKGLGSGSDAAFNAYVKKKRKQEGDNFKGVSYKEFRELNNRPTQHVTLSFTGETLADIGVTETRTEQKLVITTISSMNKKTKAKYNAKGENVGQNTSEEILNFLGAQYGNELLAVNAEEENILAQAFDGELQNLIDKYIG